VAPISKGRLSINAGFFQVVVHDIAVFGGVTFKGEAWFDKAVFHDKVWIKAAAFQGVAWFKGAAFHDDAYFDEATFHRGAGFDGAAFRDAGKGLVGARVLNLDIPILNDWRRVWPDRLTVRLDSTDPTRGTLVHMTFPLTST
jgi:Pentapeptide repeats (9 copies)